MLCRITHSGTATCPPHYHSERNHQGLDNRLIEPDDGIGETTGEITCQERLGGLLKYYDRNAA